MQVQATPRPDVPGTDLVRDVDRGVREAAIEGFETPTREAVRPVATKREDTGREGRHRAGAAVAGDLDGEMGRAAQPPTGSIDEGMDAAVRVDGVVRAGVVVVAGERGAPSRLEGSGAPARLTRVGVRAGIAVVAGGTVAPRR